MRPRHAALWCGVAAFSVYAYFYEAGGWNQNTRFDLVRALVEENTIRIDDYQANSGDKARFGLHYYADKAPGVSLVAAPAVAGVRRAMHWGGLNPRSHAALTWLSYVAGLAGAALPAALAVICLWQLARRLGTSSAASSVIALAFGLGTPFWAYGTILYGHTLAALCLLAAFGTAAGVGNEGARPLDDWLRGLVMGLLVGWAVVTEYPAAVPGAAVAAFGLSEAWRTSSRRLARVAIATALTGLLCAAVLGAYDYAAFGSPFHVSYASEEDTTLLQNGFFGLTFPKAPVVGELLWGSYRGLLPLAPVFALVPIGWVLAARTPGLARRAILFAAAAGLAGLAVNASYAHWEGGWSYGPRQLGSVFAFFLLALVPVWNRGGAILRAGVVSLALVGAGCSLVAVSTTAQPPSPTFEHPMRDLWWPAFRAGELSLNRQSYFDLRPPGEESGLNDPTVPRAAWNLGERLGLSGLASLGPLMAVLGIAITLAVRRDAN